MPSKHAMERCILSMWMLNNELVPRKAEHSIQQWNLFMHEWILLNKWSVRSDYSVIYLSIA